MQGDLTCSHRIKWKWWNVSVCICYSHYREQGQLDMVYAMSSEYLYVVDDPYPLIDKPVLIYDSEKGLKDDTKSCFHDSQYSFYVERLW